MNATQTHVTAAETTPRTRWRLPARILTTIVAFVIVSVAVRHISFALDRSPEPAGFVRGALQGALMPCAWPNLLVGTDVIIYSQNNTGITYKLGYTLGVNFCGAFFFGMFFVRLNRWRRRRNNGAVTQAK